MRAKKLFAVVQAAVLLAAACAEAKGPAVGKPAPGFTLTDVEGEKHSLGDYKGNYVVLEWVNHGCPFVKKHYNSGNMQALQKETTEKDVVWLSIASSAEGKQGHYTPQEWKKVNEEKKSAASAVLLDADGKVGKLYGAKTTPHMYVIDPQGVLIYKGAIDDKPTTDAEDVPGARNYVRAALEESMAGKPISEPVTEAYGCSVKYK
jgi:peroxiredoxin